jgi:hypothetical protein
MPRKISGDIKLDPEALLKKPELAAHIGVVSSYWTELEDELVSLYAYAMRTNPVMAAVAFGRVNSLIARLDMVEIALGFSFSLEAQTYFRKNLRDKISGCSRHRSEVIHSIWTVRDDLPDCLIRTKGLTDPKIELWAYTYRDFRELELKILELNIALKKFGQNLANGSEFVGQEKPGWKIRAP